MENLILFKSPFEKIRLGKNNDGGYVIAKLPDNYDLFLSGGVSDDISFEKNFLLMHPNTPIYAFDGTVNSLPENIKEITFIKKNLGNINTENITNLIPYIQDYNNIFMKIDIEGHEFRLIPELIKANYMTRIKQLVIEIHTPGDIKLYPEYFKGLDDITNENMFCLLNDINKTHTLIHFHANNGCKMQIIDNINLPHVFELTFIRNDYINIKIKNDEPLPTILDMPNVLNNADYFFNSYPFCNSN